MPGRGRSAAGPPPAPTATPARPEPEWCWSAAEEAGAAGCPRPERRSPYRRRAGWRPRRQTRWPGKSAGVAFWAVQMPAGARGTAPAPRVVRWAPAVSQTLRRRPVRVPGAAGPGARERPAGGCRAGGRLGVAAVLGDQGLRRARQRRRPEALPGLLEADVRRQVGEDRRRGRALAQVTLETRAGDGGQCA